MTSTQLKSWMEDHLVSVIEVAYRAGVHPNTVYRYLADGAVRRTTVARIRDLLSSSEE